ncbi:uncharacterized protein LOC116286724 [Actinia tenebrosa]|uniref:Uncharacterized protein LOC116286724 n=1 Tax=Actinia tenebrosa TaxID=6105 RepID=A0A6P8H9L5_ACTTE|nr:uncharacterized protein LOC116286724 [Actinia tenebrosa]XP_031549165.1 uncharacterized protein LOC116286724 [Actinia tenebrosa]
MDFDMAWENSTDTMDTNEHEIKHRNHAGPLPKVLYDMFLNSVRSRKLDKIQYPSGPELKALGFPKPRGGHTRRERFKHWASRMEVAYDRESEKEMLAHKRTGKLIIPLEEFENAVRRVHENEGGKHRDLKSTANIIQEKYTIGSRDFGMNKGIIRYIVDTCQECIIDYALLKKNDDRSSSRSPTPICNGLLTPESRSMVAHVPNSACIWFDKSVLLPGQEFYPRLMSLINEMRGELPGIAKGNKEAKGRFCLKLLTTLDCVRSQTAITKNAYHVQEPYTHELHKDFQELYSVYQEENITDQFQSDSRLILDVYRSAGFSDYFLRSLESSISLVSQGQSRISKEQFVCESNGLNLFSRGNMT